ncbi:MAG: VanZ family protein [Clostridia bacterium]|nr:VanZ family protein [Clostridia bacterium]
MQWYRVSSIPVLLAVLLFGMTAILLLEAASSRRAGLRRPVQWLYILALAVYFAVYLYLTFLSRKPSGQHRLRLMPFYGLMHLFEGGVFHLKIFREAFLNIILYVPFGTLTLAVFHEHPHAVRITVLSAMACTLLTEAAQYVFGMGLAETDDLIHNLLGALMGMLGFYAVHSAGSALWDSKKSVRI